MSVHVGSTYRGALKEVARILFAGFGWTGLWLALDLGYGGLIKADFSTAGLQQAYSFVLYIVGWLGIAVVFAVRGLRAFRRRVAKPL